VLTPGFGGCLEPPIFGMQFLVHWFRNLVSVGLIGAQEKACLSMGTEETCLDHLEPLGARVARVVSLGAH
jgi:hypothetical protein